MGIVTNKIVVTNWDKMGKCIEFKNIATGKIMNISQLVRAIENGECRNCELTKSVDINK